MLAHQRRQWHPTPVLLPGKSHGRRSLVGCSPWGREELDTTERLHFPFSLSCIGEGNGNPLQCSCLECPRDGGAWWAAVYEVAQNRTRLKWLSIACWLTSERSCCPLFMASINFTLWCEITTGAPAMSPSSRPEERLKAKGHFPAGSSLFKQTETELLPELHHVATSHCEGDKEKDSLILATLNKRRTLTLRKRERTNIGKQHMTSVPSLYSWT